MSKKRGNEGRFFNLEARSGGYSKYLTIDTAQGLSHCNGSLVPATPVLFL